MEIISLASSSKGNSYVLLEGSNALILECGLPLKEVLRAIKKKVKKPNISVFITHEHLDHSKYVLDYLKAGYFVYSTLGTKMKLIEKMEDIQKYNNYYVFRKGVKTKYDKVDLDTFSILPFSTKHDSLEPCGYFINNTITNEKVLFATDTYYIKERFKGITTLMIECNYSKDLLMTNYQNGSISYTQYRRLLESHFELENVKVFINATDTTNLKEVYLLHLSERNSNEELFKKEIARITGVPVYVCKERS